MFTKAGSGNSWLAMNRSIHHDEPLGNGLASGWARFDGAGEPRAGAHGGFFHPVHVGDAGLVVMVL